MTHALDISAAADEHEAISTQSTSQQHLQPAFPPKVIFVIMHVYVYVYVHVYVCQRVAFT